MNSLFFNCVIKLKYAAPWLRTRCVQNVIVEDYSKLSPVKTLQLLRVLRAYPPNFVYDPLTHGSVKLRLYARNVEIFTDTLIGQLEAIEKDASIPSVKTELRATTIDKWLVSTKDEPYYLSTVIKTLLPIAIALTEHLVNNETHISIGYYQRQCSKTMHDLIVFLSHYSTFKDLTRE